MGMTTLDKDIWLVRRELEAARKKHPVFATCLFGQGSPEELLRRIESALAERQIANDEAEARGEQSVDGIITEELYEAEEAALSGDYDLAIREFAQLAGTAISAMDFCRAMKESTKR